MKSRHAVIFAATVILVAGGAAAQTHLATAEIDQAVIAKLSAHFGIHSKVITHLDLTQPFQTKSQWSLVAAKQPDEESNAQRMDWVTQKGQYIFALSIKASRRLGLWKTGDALPVPPGMPGGC